MIFTTELEHILNQIDLDAPIPEKEPERQYYFIKRARKLVEKETQRLGRKPTCCVNTFGCQMNARDSEKLSGIKTCFQA